MIATGPLLMDCARWPHGVKVCGQDGRTPVQCEERDGGWKMTAHHNEKCLDDNRYCKSTATLSEEKDALVSEFSDAPSVTSCEKHDSENVNVPPVGFDATGDWGCRIAYVLQGL